MSVLVFSRLCGGDVGEDGVCKAVYWWWWLCLQGCVLVVVTVSAKLCDGGSGEDGL